MNSYINYRLSIIIPVYNVEQYIAECLHSVMKLDNGMVECIIVNDCTKDSSIIIAKEIISVYDGPISFKIIEHDRNKGLSEARNTGIMHSSGYWLFFLDSDDYVIPDNFLYCFDFAEGNRDADIIQTCFQGKKSFDLLSNVSSCSSVEAQKYYLQGYFPPYAWGRFIKRNFIIDNNLYFKAGVIGREDTIWLLDVLTKINIVKYVPKEVLYYRENPSSILHSEVYSQRKFDGMNCLLEKCIEVASAYEINVIRYFMMQDLLAFNYELLENTHGLNASSLNKFKEIKGIAKNRLGGRMPLKYLIIWYHIYSPLKYLLLLSKYRMKFFTYFYRIRTL